MLAWLFSDVTDHEFQTGSNPRIRAWFAPDDVRKASRQAARQAQDRAQALPLPASELSLPFIPNRSTSSLPRTIRSHKAPIPSSSRLRLELDLSEEEDEWAPEKWIGPKAPFNQRSGGSTPNLLSSAAYASPVSGELRATVSNAFERPHFSLSPSSLTAPANSSPDPGRTPTLRSFPSNTTLRQGNSSSLVPSSTPPQLRPARSLKSIRSFGDLKAAAKESLGMGEKARKELVPPVPKVQDWQKNLARAPPPPPTALEPAFILQPPQRPQLERQGSSGPRPPMSSPPRVPLPAVPSAPPREMPRLKPSRSLDLLRSVSGMPEAEQVITRTAPQYTSLGGETAVHGLTGSFSSPSISSLASATGRIATSNTAVVAPPAIPPRKTSLSAPPRPTSRPSLPRHISTTTYGVDADVVLKLLYPEGQCNVLLRVPKSVTLAQVKASVHAKFASSGVVRLPAAAADWGLAYTLVYKAPPPLFEDEPAFARYELPDCPSFDYARRHNRGASSSTTGSTYTARSSLSMSSGRASTAMTSPSIASRPTSLALISNEADWQEALKGWREGKLALRIMC